MNKVIHTVGAFLLHPLGHMAVNIQREGRSCVAKVVLHGFDVISGL